MRGQRLRQVVRVMKPVRTRSDGGSMSISYLKIADRPAAIVPISATDRIRADQAVSDVTHRIRMWWFQDLTPDHRIEMDGRVFEIRGSINADERNKITELLCTEQAATT